MRRFTLTREAQEDSLIKRGYTVYKEDEETKTRSFIRESDSIFYTVGMQGRAGKPRFNFSFRCKERAVSHIENWHKDRVQVQKLKAERRKTHPRTLKVGDVLCASWGYEQTNVDYFQVVGLVGSRSVVLREIAADKVEEGYMSGECTPLVDYFIGEGFTKQVTSTGDAVNISSSKWASKKEPLTVVGGVKLYSSDRWSSYY